LDLGESDRELLVNPTRLSNKKIEQSLRRFVETVEGGKTYRELAHLFVQETKRTPSYQDFKAGLYHYLITTIDPKYGRHSFYKQLDRQLRETFPESNDRPLDDFLVVRTCRQIFEFLIAKPDNHNYYLFVDLIGNLGIPKTMGLLLQIALLSHGVKPHFETHLEKRFSVLFKYYENWKICDLSWLVEALEHLNIALATNLSKVDFSVLKDSQ
jgi:hypothetical protein